MGHHTDCANWDYETHPNANEVATRCAFLLRVFRTLPKRLDRYGLSTIAGHAYIFKGMAPPLCDYFVGNYRGSDFPCLKEYGVRVGGDRRVGTHPKLVKKQIRDLEVKLKAAIEAFERASKTPAALANPGAVLAKFVSIACHFLTMFLTIHPYANGNGHMGRLLVWVLLGRFNFWPVAWPLDDSPNYGQALSMYRDGNLLPLNHFILKCIRG
jgi:hypothetical protein